MAAYGALASLLNSIDQIMNHPHLSTALDQKQIQLLQEKAALLLDFIEAYNYGGAVSKQSQKLEKQIVSAAHAAEDLIDSHIFDQIIAPSVDIDGETSSSSGVNLMKKVRDMKRRIACAAKDQIHGGSKQAYISCSLDLQLIIKDMDTMLKEGAKVKEELALKEEHPTHSRPFIRTGERVMVGFDDELIQLLDELTNQRTSRDIISIVGMGGAGKTTLAQNVYQNLLIKQHFDIRAWATVSHQHNVGEILSQLLPVQGESSSRNDDDELGEQLHKTLSGRRYLIILDDIWSVEAWDEVRHFFPDNGNRSRVVLTTRLSNVARDCHSNSCVTMKPLDEHENWKLFCKKAFGQETCPHPELEGVGKEIARLCRGLPLSTVVIGGLLLNSPGSLKVWKKVVTNMKSNTDSKEKKESLDILSLSYNHLPPHLKTCFLYMGVFKEDSKIRVSTIINLWIAVGFVRANNTQILEEVAEGYLKELINRNLILVSEYRHNGKIRCCVIHDLVRDLCLKVGEQQDFFHVIKGEVRFRECRHIHSVWSIFGLLPSAARSTLEEPVNHKLLRVLDFESSPYVYGNINLRFLVHKPSFCLNPMWKLPSSVSLIWNLQTLIITGFFPRNVVIAPIEIWKMRSLRHVKCDQIYVPDPPSDGMSMMDSLRTLTTAMNLRVSKDVCKRIPNIKKMYIAYGGHRQGYDDRLIECLSNLDCLHKLESPRSLSEEANGRS